VVAVQEQHDVRGALGEPSVSFQRVETGEQRPGDPASGAHPDEQRGDKGCEGDQAAPDEYLARAAGRQRTSRRAGSS